MTQPNTGPLDERPQVLARDPEAHRKLDTILSWIQGDEMHGRPGMAAEHRRHAERLDAHEARIDRHSERLHALEQAGTERMRWTLKTLAERLVTLGAAAVAGWAASLFVARPHP